MAPSICPLIQTVYGGNPRPGRESGFATAFLLGENPLYGMNGGDWGNLDGYVACSPVPLDYRVVTAWLWLGCRVFIRCVSGECRVVAAWLPHGCRMVVAWLPHGWPVYLP